MGTCPTPSSTSSCHSGRRRTRSRAEAIGMSRSLSPWMTRVGAFTRRACAQKRGSAIRRPIERLAWRNARLFWLPRLARSAVRRTWAEMTSPLTRLGSAQTSSRVSITSRSGPRRRTRRSSRVSASPGTDSAAITPSIAGSGLRTCTPGTAGSTSTSFSIQPGWSAATRIEMWPPMELPMRVTGSLKTCSINAVTSSALAPTAAERWNRGVWPKPARSIARV